LIKIIESVIKLSRCTHMAAKGQQIGLMATAVDHFDTSNSSVRQRIVTAYLWVAENETRFCAASTMQCRSINDKPYLTKLSGLNLACADLAFNAALVISTSDLEGSVVTPALVPGVDHEPVILSIFNTPSDDLDSVTAKRRARGVLVNAGLVVWEVRVDGEGPGDRSIGHDVGLDLQYAADAVRLLCVLLIVAVALAVLAIGAFLGAPRSRVFLAWARTVLRALHVVSARLEGIWKAGSAVLLSVVATGYDTMSREPTPSHTRLSTIAAH